MSSINNFKQVAGKKQNEQEPEAPPQLIVNNKPGRGRGGSKATSHN